jgi:hypothetical protein
MANTLVTPGSKPGPEQRHQPCILEAVLIGPLPVIFELGLVLRLVIRGVEVVDAGGKAGVHDRQILIGQREIDHQLRADLPDQRGQRGHVLGIDGIGRHARRRCVPSPRGNRIALRDGAARKMDLVRRSAFIAILCTATEPTPPAPITRTLLKGTLGLEAETQLKARGIGGPIHLISCCGGGGLSGGLALACPEATLSIAEPEGWDDVIRSLAAGEIVSVADQHHPTPCDALQTPRTYPINFDILKKRVSSSAVVTPAEIAAAMRLVFEKLHLVVEPGGAAALAAVLSGKLELVATPVVTLSGGNVDWDTYQNMVGGVA